jgi:DNA-binding SARP family transcriptional activator/WD40 repeat protein
MRIAVLGPLEVLADDGNRVAVPGAKERLLLAVLTAGVPDAVSTDRILQALWNGDRPATARRSLQVHLVHLRTALEPDRPRGSTGRLVVRRGAGYALAADREDVDALVVADLAARGRARLAAGDPGQAAQMLTEALALWRGEPYADWPDAPFAETERRRLTEVRAAALTALLEARLALGEHADLVPELERLVAEDPLQEEWWRLLVLALYRSGRQGNALAAARRARRVLASELGTDPGPRLQSVEAAVLAHDSELDYTGTGTALSESPRPPSDVAVCPYKGLATYQAADSRLFHGRDRLVNRLLARLVDAPLFVVSGPSGAGKSSVVRAGLVPALTAGVLPGSEGWRAVVLTPGRRPVDVLTELTGDTAPDVPVLLVCDQFEELWAPGVEPAERTAFLDTVLGLLDDGVVVRCVAVVRGDHVDRLAEHAGVAERLEGALILVPPPTDAELREIVLGPADTAGLIVEPELLDTVVADVTGRPGALPLLSTALVGTWERRRGDRLTLAGYLEAGGVAGALARSAEAAYAALHEPAQQAARRLLVRLADVDDGGALVRRRVPLDELDLRDGPRRTVVDTLVERRLLAIGDDRLEVAHEALLTAWPRLAGWLEDDAAGRAIRRHLAPAALEWHRRGRPDEELYRGPRLVAALDWAGGAGDGLTLLEREFLEASRRAADAELTAARQRADRETAARHRTRRLAAGLAGVLVVALVAAFLAVRAQRSAVRASVTADANRLAALSTTASSLDVAMLLAAQAQRLADTPETRDALLGALTEHGRAERVVAFPGDLRMAALARGGRTLFLGAGGQVVTWQVGSAGDRQVAFDIPDDWGALLNVAASPIEDAVMGAGETFDGVHWLRMIYPDGTSRLLRQGDEVGGLPIGSRFDEDGSRVDLMVSEPDPDDPEHRARWTLTDVDTQDGTSRPTGIGGTYPAPFDELGVDFAHDGSSAVLSSDDASVPAIMIDLTDGRQTRTPVQDRPGTPSEFRSVGTGAAQLWEDGGITLVDRDGTVRQQLDVHQEQVRDVVTAPDGTWGVTVGDGPLAILWDIDPRSGRWSQRERLTGHGGDILEAEVAPDGGRLITISADHTIITWDMGPDGGFGESYPALSGRWIAARPQAVPDGLVVAPTRPGAFDTADRGANPGPDTMSVSASFLDAATGVLVEEVEVGDTIHGAVAGGSVAVSPDRSMVAVTWTLGTTVLDTRTHEVVTKIVLPPNGAVGNDRVPVPATVVWSAGWTPDGSTLLLGAERNLVEMTGGYLVPVDTTTWEVGAPIEIGGSASAIAASPDGTLLAMAVRAAGGIVILDARTLEVLRRAPLATDDVLQDLSFSADGRWLAGGGGRGVVHVFDTGTWESASSSVTVHDHWLMQVEWLGDGRTIATTGADGTVSLFDVERGLARTRPLPGSGEPGSSYAHLLPGPTDEIVVLRGDRSGWRYPLEPSVWLHEACAIAGRDLTTGEWDRYLPGRDYQHTCTGPS